MKNISETIAKPNLFEFATKELSQDAFLCWLVSWSQKNYEGVNNALHQCGKDFLNSLLEMGGVKPPPTTYEKVEVRQQKYNIDILIIVNGQYLILIEDKIDAGETNNQTERYKDEIERKQQYKHLRKVYIYFKTGDFNSPSDERLKETGFKLYGRKKFLEVLGEPDKIKNSIFSDFHQHLLCREERSQSYKNLKKGEAWEGDTWAGYFKELQGCINNSAWNYVANQSGGFMGFWWDPKQKNSADNYNVYLQLEEEKLCLKIWVAEKENRKVLRDTILGLAEEYGGKKPSRKGDGTWMTCAILDGDFRKYNDDNSFNSKETLKKLKEAEKNLKEMHKQLDKMGFQSVLR